MVSSEKSVPSAKRSTAEDDVIDGDRMAEPTWIGPDGLEISVIVSWQLVGTLAIQIERHASTLQWSIDRLERTEINFALIL